MWIAIPSSRWTLTTYSLPVSRRTPTVCHGPYVTRFAVSIPPARAEICLSAVANTAGSLRLDCNVEEV
jgi:hypothetical protein